jgi:hypothetical protein
LSYSDTYADCHSYRNTDSYTCPNSYSDTYADCQSKPYR